MVPGPGTSKPPGVYVHFMSSLNVDMEIAAVAEGFPSEQPFCKHAGMGWLFVQS